MGNIEFEELFKKSYSELSLSEKEELKDLAANEEEFEGMKLFFAQMETNLVQQEESPSVEVKQKLDDVFYAQHPKDRGVGLWAIIPVIIPEDKSFWQQPLVRIAAVVIVALMAVPFFRSIDSDKVQLADNKKIENAADKNLREGNKKMTQDDGEAESTGLTVPVIENQLETRLSSSVSFDSDAAPSPLIDRTVDHTFAGVASFSHPDGVFMDELSENEEKSNKPKPVAENISVLDLLTATF